MFIKNIENRWGNLLWNRSTGIVQVPRRPIKGRAVCGYARRRARSWPFDTLVGAICLTFRALSDAPISVADGHDLDPLRAWSQIALPLIGLLGI